MAIVRYVLAALKPGVDPDDYERFEREVDYAVSTKIKSIVSYRTHRISDTRGTISGGPWQYIERIEITDRKAYEEELAVAGKDLLAELYDKYLDKTKTVSFWSTLIEP